MQRPKASQHADDTVAEPQGQRSARGELGSHSARSSRWEARVLVAPRAGNDPRSAQWNARLNLGSLVRPQGAHRWRGGSTNTPVEDLPAQDHCRKEIVPGFRSAPLFFASIPRTDYVARAKRISLASRGGFRSARDEPGKGGSVAGSPCSARGILSGIFSRPGSTACARSPHGLRYITATTPRHWPVPVDRHRSTPCSLLPPIFSSQSGPIRMDRSRMKKAEQRPGESTVSLFLVGATACAAVARPV